MKQDEWIEEISKPQQKPSRLRHGECRSATRINQKAKEEHLMRTPVSLRSEIVQGQLACQEPYWGAGRSSRW